MPRKTRPLPPFAHEYIEAISSTTSAVARTTLGHLHEWLRARHIGIRLLTAEGTEEFLVSSVIRTRTPATQACYRSQLLLYFRWLHAQGLLSFDPDVLRRSGRRLAEPAEAFMTSLTPTHRPSTCNGYRSCLRRLHGWLEAQDVALSDFTREHLVRRIFQVATGTSRVGTNENHGAMTRLAPRVLVTTEAPGAWA